MPDDARDHAPSARMRASADECHRHSRACALVVALVAGLLACESSAPDENDRIAACLSSGGRWVAGGCNGGHCESTSGLAPDDEVDLASDDPDLATDLPDDVGENLPDDVGAETDLPDDLANGVPDDEAAEDVR